ncbi:hypothetical protein HDV02_006153 [Globomyces sp. JEL0801]|nr:hypothetical protein HDV02_006153 [Globomyces sp. JEL0801]
MTTKKRSNESEIEPPKKLLKTLPEVIEFKNQPVPGAIKLVSWNVAGINAALKKGFERYVEAEDPDILMLQETKANTDLKYMKKSRYPFQYQSHCTSKKGYSGTAVFSKFKPLSVEYKVNDDELDQEEWYLIASYIVNAGTKLERLDLKHKHFEKLESYFAELQTKKPIIWTGAHTEIDLARPKSNLKTAGFTPQERADLTRLIENRGLVDTFRQQNPDVKDRYTYYSYRFDCRTKNLGWRIDYFFVDNKLLEKVILSDIRSDIYGASDHCPILLILKDEMSNNTEVEDK